MMKSESPLDHVKEDILTIVRKAAKRLNFTYNYIAKEVIMALTSSIVEYGFSEDTPKDSKRYSFGK